MSCEIDTATLLRRIGHKVTPQRMSILGIVRHSQRRLSASAIHEQVMQSYPFVDVSTVYRTLGVAKDLGLVVELDVGSGDAEYEWAGEADHYHMICEHCGAEIVGEGDEVQAMIAAIEREHGFKANLKHLAIVGACKGCQPSSAGV